MLKPPESNKQLDADRTSLSVSYCPISQLILDAENPRLHSHRQISQIARSIKAFGFNVPILMDSKGKVIAGHGRVLAAQRLDLSEVPAMLPSHLRNAEF